jgi:hypothetical protein
VGVTNGVGESAAGVVIMDNRSALKDLSGCAIGNMTSSKKFWQFSLDER